MLVYHGTSLKAWGRIQNEGILPRGQSKFSNWEETIESNPDTVYFTNAYALYFGVQASKDEDAFVIVEIDTDKLNQDCLVADEDVLEQVSRQFEDGLPKGWDMVQRTRHYRSMAKEYAKAGLGFEWSMNHMGTAGYTGPIPKTAITRVAIVDKEKQKRLVFEAIEPTITIMNYKILGEWYQNMVKFVFDGVLPQPSPLLKLLRPNQLDEDRDGIVVSQCT